MKSSVVRAAWQYCSTDDASHARRGHADAQRDLKLHRVGLRVLRIPAALVLSDLAAAVALVRAAL